MLQTTELEYNAGSVLSKGYLAYDDRIQTTMPAIIIAHDWTGRNEFCCKKARELASNGYIAFALDMYGNAHTTESRHEKLGLLEPLKADRKELLTRVQAALTAVKQLDNVDQNKIAAMGYCFGGMCVLDLARSGANISGVVSFHGILTPPTTLVNNKITSKILVLHGYDDVFVPPSQITDFSEEMNNKDVNWQLYTYGKTAHSFTNPLANDSALGLHYNKEADRRSWLATKNFFDELFC